MTPRLRTPHRVGLIVPSSNVTMETEIPALLSRHPAAADRGVTFHSSRATLHRVDPGSLRRMVTESDRCARELADARLDVVALSACVQMPSLAVLDEVSREAQVPVLSAATATADEVLALLADESAAAPVSGG
jgi:maleate isomerase